ncbi:MAG: NTP transferase domain-containing protein [Deltaproteobacteria bacterium]|nr:NTP transferase domain-containing protein [Deltaproteobacteria bacterium]
MKVLAVIPARYASSRFPGKALVSVGGEPLVARVARRVLASGVADAVLVATDDARIANAAASTGCEVLLSDEPFRTGSDRVAAAARDRRVELVLNVQGDEALVGASLLEGALAALARGDLGTVAVPLGHPSQLEDPDTVKVAVTDGRAHAFFRRPAPAMDPGAAPLVHVGVYAFTAETLQAFSALSSTSGELAHGLEQLRALERGWSVGVTLVDAEAASVNRPSDLRDLARFIPDEVAP